MPQQPQPDPTRAPRASEVAARLADVLDQTLSSPSASLTPEAGVPVTLPRYQTLRDLVAQRARSARMLPPLPSPAGDAPATTERTQTV